MNNKEKKGIFALKFNKICEMNRSHIFGYLLGLLIFVIGIPALMWLVSGRPWPYVPDSPRTKHLMTSGPYRLCRNPMLVGIYIYDAGVSHASADCLGRGNPAYAASS